MFTSLQYSNISYKTACLCFNAITSSTPAYLSDLLHLYCPSRSLRSIADTCLLKIPLYKCKTKGDRAFLYFGPSVWNSVPLHIRNATTIDTVKSALKTYLFSLQESYKLISAWFALCKCVCDVWCVMCMCVDSEGERERGRENVCNRRDCAPMCWCIIM